MIITTSKHTRAMSAQYFTHVFGLFDLDQDHPIMRALENEGISTILDIFDESEMTIDDYQYEDEGVTTYLTRGEKRLLRSIYKWLFWLNRQYPNLEYSKLEQVDYDEYLEQLHQQANPVPSVTTSMAATTSASTQQVVLNANVKWDIKQYPTFNGDNASWPKFKRGVISIAITHGLDKIFDEKYQVPDKNDPSYQLYQEKNKFVYSIWVSRIHSGLAYTVLREFEEDRDGRGVYLKLLQFYETKHNKRQMAIMAMNRLNKLYLNYNTAGGAVTYVNQFREALQDLKEADEPMSDVLAKSMFLSRIQDKEYDYIVDMLMNSNDDFEACVTRVLDKYYLMNPMSNHSPRQNNKVERSYGNKNFYIPPDVWHTLTKEQKQIIMEARRNNQSNKSNDEQYIEQQENQNFQR